MKSPHIPFAHEFWSKFLSSDDHVIDATCGNGHDTVALAKLLPHGKVFAFDLQEAAIEKTRERLIQEGMEERVTLFFQSHETFPDMLPEAIKLIVYNLGYLPGGDKSVTTKTGTSIKSINSALKLLKKRGVVFITLYPGHPEGEIEAKAILEFARELPKEGWSVGHEVFSTKESAPSVLHIEKTLQQPCSTK